MRISLPITLPTNPIFGEVKRGWFSNDTVGSYRCDLPDLHTNLSAAFIEIQKCGWSIDSIVPVTGGVYHFDVKKPGFAEAVGGSNQFTGAGYGFGLGATEALIIMCSRVFSGDQLNQLFEVVRVECSTKMNLQQLEKYKDELDRFRKTEEEIRAKPVAPIKQGLRRQIVGWDYDGQQYSGEVEGNQAKEAMLQDVASQITQYEDYLRTETSRITEASKNQLSPDLQNFAGSLSPNKEFMECLVDVVASSFLTMEPDSERELLINTSTKADRL